MAGQVDVIISKQAIKEIQIATAQLEQLRIKILQVNKASAKSGGVGVSDNQALTSQLVTLNKLVTANNKLSVSANKRLTAIKKNTAATNQSTSANKKNAKSVGSLSNGVKALGIAFISTRIVQFISNVFSLAKTFDSLRFALERTSTNLEEARMNTSFMLNLSKDLGLSLIATTTRFIKFAAAARNSGLALKDTQKIFGTMAKAGAVLGLRTDELSGVFLALEQMLSKGKVTTEELRRQLGERLPGAFGIMAASLGVTLPKLDEMLKKGELLSADVLPGFADAVEVAFGLDTVTKVNTLVAAQNRLTTSWQNFVKNLTTEGGTVSNVFKGILKELQSTLDFYAKIVNKTAFLEELNLTAGFEKEGKILTFKAKQKLESSRKEGEKLADLETKILKAKEALVRNLSNKSLEEDLRLAVAAKIEYNKVLGDLEQKEAEKRFNSAYALVLKQKKILEEAKGFLTTAESAKVSPAGSRGDVARRVADNQKNIANNIERVTQATNQLNLAQGALNKTRLIAGKSTKAQLDPKKDSTKKSLSEINDLTNKANISQLQKEIAYNEEKIKIAENGSKKMSELIERNTQKELQIAGIVADDKIAIAKKASEKLIKEAEEFGLKGEDLRKRLDEIEKQRANKQSIAEEEKQKTILAIRQKYLGINEKQAKEGFELKKIGIEASTANELTKLREVYNEDLKTTKDKKSRNKKYLLDKNKLEVESFNLVIDLRIEEAKALALLNDGNNEYTEGLNDRIDILEGMKKTSKVEGGETSTKEQEQFDLNMEYLGKYADAVGDIAGSIYDAKIARIDNEIEAEANKYAVLFALAEGDAEQTRYLQIQQERDREILEKKKRKLLKKQAIAEKANALISIAINTAIAVSKTLAGAGVFGIPLVPVIYGLGALQAAAVLAQPIPEFAEGGIMNHDGPALVGDGGKHEVIRTPDGKVSLTPNTDTVMNLPKGTEIFSSVQKFNQENPTDMSNMLHSASLLASISLNQKNVEGMMIGQRELDERLLDAMLLNTKAVKNSKSNTFVKTQKIDIAHELWKSKLLN
jgi:tape measure domain-containing protein